MEQVEKDRIKVETRVVELETKLAIVRAEEGKIVEAEDSVNRISLRSSARV